MESTVPEVIYYDLEGNTMELSGQSVMRLIYYDLVIRSSPIENVNVTGLELKFEQPIRRILDKILEPGNSGDYLFTAEGFDTTGDAEPNAELYITSSDDVSTNGNDITELTTGMEPVFEKHLTYL